MFSEVRYKHSPRRIPHIRAGLALLRLRAGFANHTSAHTSRAKGRLQSLCSITFGNRLGAFVTYLHLVWGRVVPDIPAFCRELVAALAEG